MNNKKYYIFEMNMTTLNVGCIILLMIMMIISIFIYPSFINDVIENVNFLFFFVLYFFYMILHEIFHSIAYVIYGSDYKKITYGVCLEKGVLCCLCKQNVDRRNILHSLMFPLFYIGIVTYIISLIFRMPLLFLLSIFNISGCIGDIIMFIFILRLDKNIQFSEFDDPVGFAIYSDRDVSNFNHFGLRYIESTNELKRCDLKKIRVSKFSFIFLIILLLFGTLMELWR